LGLPDESFDYEEFTRREFAPEPLRRRGPYWLWWVVAALVTLVLVTGYLGF
jgi:hypothetical protein